MRDSSRPIIVAGLLTGVMLAFLLFLAMPSVTGKDVLLPLEPVDPFDPLRGQYLILSYAINRPATLPGLPGGLGENQSVYVLLQQDAAGLAVPVRASTSPLQAGRGQTLLRGHVERGRVLYGIEAYFIERGAVPEVSLAGALARIMVQPDGRASVVGLLKDGRPLTFRSSKRSFWQR